MPKKQGSLSNSVSRQLRFGKKNYKRIYWRRL